jgi:dolichol-phosphate mannosyltransferase
MKLVAVIPCYNVANHIEKVIDDVLPFVTKIICVNDCSTDSTLSILQQCQEKMGEKMVLIEHKINLGVGGAMKTGFKKAIELDAAIVVKLDGDGQMDVNFIPKLTEPLVRQAADFTKGNRFNDLKALKQMPAIRRIGNIGMSFLIKAASGYWHIFDPANGFIAIKSSLLRQIDIDKLSNRYYFESSLLCEIGLAKASVADVAMPAIYGDEKSNLSIKRVLFEFPPKIFRSYWRRIILSYYLYDFSIASVYLLLGALLFFSGLVFGIIKWIYYSKINEAAPTGTVMVATLLIVLGFQLLISFLNYDIEKNRK